MVSVEDATTATRSLGAHASPTCYPNGSDNLQAMRGNHHYEVLLTRKIESSTASVSGAGNGAAHGCGSALAPSPRV
jgi:hypothetical protein